MHASRALALALAHTRLGPIDLLIVAAYLIGITLFGLRFRKRNKAVKGQTLKNYFLADNTIPWWAIALSIVSAETSTLTIISVPGVAFTGDFGFLQIVLGYMVGRVVVALLFLPRYFAGEMLTAYQLIDRRFGPVLHKVTAGLFLLTRAAAEGVRVFAVSIVVAIAIGTGDVLSIAIISALTLLYTFEGGMAAVIWTDVVQMAIYVGGTLVALLTLGSHVGGGWPHILTAAHAVGKFHWLDFTANLTTTYTFWAGVLGGAFLTMASHGTDQLMVQRLLAARNLRQSQAALLSSGVVIFVQFAMFLLIGAGLWVFYGQHPGTATASPDRLFPSFIVHEMPVGIAGLLVAAILAAAMSNLSAALNSLASTSVVDFFVRLKPQADDRQRNLMAKASTIVWAFLLFAIAVYSIKVGGKGHVVEIGLSIASVAYGCLLGVFLLGTLTRYATERGAIVGMITGFALNLWLWLGHFPKTLGSSAMKNCTVTNNVMTCELPHTLTIPHIAWTWYVLIGAVVTFAVGSLFSLILRAKPRRLAMVAPLLFLLSCPLGTCFSHAQAQTPGAPFIAPPHRAMSGVAQQSAPATPPAQPAYDFSPISQLINDAIAQHKLPGAVVVIGHKSNVVFQQAYGNRKLAGEPGAVPGPDGRPDTGPEPMTLDTIFDMASLTKCLATATAIMQLYEQGKLDVDAPVQQYLPDFNPTNDPERARVTVRLLLTHFSGEAPDVNLKDAWGLALPDRAEGLHRALSTPLQSAPGTVFRYSDINFILLGAIVERISHQREDDYAREHIFSPLGMMETGYHAFDRVCGPKKLAGAAVSLLVIPNDRSEPIGYMCRSNEWQVGFIKKVAPTAHDDESKAHPADNPNFDHLLRGTVHDPTTRRMGGVAGHAGVFSTAHDVSLFASALLEKLLHNTGPFPLKQSTLQLMTAPEQPGHSSEEITAANAAELREITAGEKGSLPNLAPEYPAIKEQSLRAFGWDIDTGFSKPRGEVFPIGSFGHTGFTGTSLWFDPASDTYVILLANAIHPRGATPISNLRGQVASAAAEALGLHAPHAPTLLGLDVLEQTHFAQLATLAQQHNGQLRLGLMTNQTGLDSHGRRTVDILSTDLPTAVPTAKLARIFTPEHGLFGKQDTTHLTAEVDATSNIPVVSLYGAKDADRRPTHERLADLDAVVIDLQDAGVRYYTYESVVGYFVEAAAREARDFHHPLTLVILDRPNMIGGLAVQGPPTDPGAESYTSYMAAEPERHGLTLGELALFINGTRNLGADVSVVKMQNWTRDEYFDDTQLPWTNPSPNLRTVRAAVLYPAALFEGTNISVGRGTDTPFEWFGAGLPAKNAKTGEQKPAWFNADDVAAALTARHIPGVTFDATTMTIADDTNHYPFHGQTIPAVHLTVTNRNTLDSPELGLEIMAVLHRLYPTEFTLARAKNLVVNQATMDALTRGDDPRTIAAGWQPALDAFKAQRAAYLLY